MPAVVTKWPDSRRPEVEAALRESSTVREAAERMGITEPTLRGAFKAWRLDYHALLKRAAPVVQTPPPGGVLVQGNGPELEQGSSEVKSTCEPLNMDWSGARPQSSGVGLERRLIISDSHFPFASVRACAGVIALAKAIQPHVILHLGDAWNAGAVSHHPPPFGGRENHRGAQVQGLSFFDALARAAPGARKILLSGNHDDWLLEFEDQHAEFAGMFAAKWMGLDRLGWELVDRERQPLILGPVAYKHGTGGGEHFAKRYAERDAALYDVACVVVGHHHTFQHYQARNGREAWGCGWLGRPQPRNFDYAKKGGEPAHWHTGALVQDVIGSRVTTTTVRMDDGAALYGGRLVAA